MNNQKIESQKSSLTALRKDGFTFKQFFIAHDKSPMRVTTDSALLGAWAPIEHKPHYVLDIGCGCGILGLMLAQRLSNQSHIDLIDVDSHAIEQSLQNIKDSPFSHLQASQCDFNEYQSSYPYDLIITNPPYFEPANDCRTQQRQQARYTQNLNFMQLISQTKKLLSKQGYFCLVLPFHLSASFIHLCLEQSLYLKKQMNVQYNESKSASLSLLCFSLESISSPILEAFILREKEGAYTRQAKALLKDFYLFCD